MTSQEIKTKLDKLSAERDGLLAERDTLQAAHDQARGTKGATQAALDVVTSAADLESVERLIIGTQRDYDTALRTEAQTRQDALIAYIADQQAHIDSEVYPAFLACQQALPLKMMTAIGIDPNEAPRRQQDNPADRATALLGSLATAIDPAVHSVEEIEQGHNQVIAALDAAWIAWQDVIQNKRDDDAAKRQYADAIYRRTLAQREFFELSNLTNARITAKDYNDR
jgi:hypothetical protein